MTCRWSGATSTMWLSRPVRSWRSRRSLSAPAGIGRRTHGEIGIRVSRTLPLDRVVAIKDALVMALREVEPGAEITVTDNPIQVDDETAI